MTKQYGPPIPVSGVRPEWLRDDDMVLAAAIPINARMIDWPRFSSIRIPITHPASICQQRALDHPDEAPFYPVYADGTVPGDYDGGDVLLRDSSVARYSILLHWSECLIGTIVGYRRKATTAGPMPTCAPDLPTYDPATHALVERMTKGQAVELYAGWRVSEVFEALGIIKPDPDPIAEYAAKRGLDVEELRALVNGAAA